MYLLFRYKKWEPQRYYQMGYGARKVVAAFMLKEMEEREAQALEMREW